MARIDPLRRGLGALPGVRRPVRRGGTPPEPERTAEGIPVNVVPLVDEIDLCGSALLKDPTGSYLNRYTTAVRLFLDAAIHDSMRVNSEATHGLRQKVFSTIARIDMALADLTDAVLGRQQDVLKLRSILDLVKGMVVDLYR